MTAEEKDQFQELFPEPKRWLGFYDENKGKDIYENNILLWNESVSNKVIKARAGIKIVENFLNKMLI